MQKMLINETTKERRVIEAEPKCSEVFCEQCGECLHCYGHDSCWSNGEPVEGHSTAWIVYLDPTVDDMTEWNNAASESKA